MITRTVTYECAQCHEYDSPIYFENESTIPTIICWSCRAGSKMSMQDALMAHKGMFPVPRKAK